MPVVVPDKGGEDPKESLGFMAWMGGANTPGTLNVVGTTVNIKIQSRNIDWTMKIFRLDQGESGATKNMSIGMFTGADWLGNVLVVGWNDDKGKLVDLGPEDIVAAMEAVMAIVKNNS
ncbi:hypothetical protein B0H11DRAFT_1923009 [Mycena galericulata]|nr:hypothetical protein B0H11DRAFT_1923009 [Mycena galericulata]